MGNQRLIIGFFVILLTGVGLYAVSMEISRKPLTNTPNQTKSDLNTQVIVGKTTFDVEVADDAAERQRGLMDRTQLGDSEGMLFIFDEPQSLYFWNKRTELHLAVVWIHDGKVTGISELLPEDASGTYTVESPGNAEYALEIPYRVVDRITIGDSVIVK